MIARIQAFAPSQQYCTAHLWCYELIATAASASLSHHNMPGDFSTVGSANSHLHFNYHRQSATATAKPPLPAPPQQSETVKLRILSSRRLHLSVAAL